MHYKSMRATFCVMALLFFTPQLHAQDTLSRWFLGVVGGYNANYHYGGFYTATIPASATSNCGCETFSNGSGNGAIAGLAGEYWMNNSGSSALQFRLYYEQKPGNFTTLGYPLPYFDTTTNQEITYSRIYTVHAKYDLINLECLYRSNIPFVPHLGVSIGPKLGYAVNTRYIEYDSLPPPFVNANGYYIDENIPAVNSLHFGIKAGIQYELQFDKFLITSAISYDYGITKVAPSWYVSTLVGTIDLMYGL